MPMTLHDRVLGTRTLTPSSALGDFPLTRKNLEPSYQLAVVVDDFEMGVTEVVRGDDLWPSTFRQKQLIDRLGYRCPEYAHVPLVTGTDGRRLAKRHGDTRLSQYREQGRSPWGIIGWAAHTAGIVSEGAEVRPQELVASFRWERVSRSVVVIEKDLTGDASVAKPS